MEAETVINGLDLFSGIGGLSMALHPWVRPVAYCERDEYATAVLLSRQREGTLPVAPIWQDVRTLTGAMLPTIDIIFGGFPCQDISVAGLGAGLDGERSGLVFEIFRLLDETKAPLVFLENVPAIRTRGLGVILKELAHRGYDTRFTMLSAEDVGANHKRNRWFLAATHTERLHLRIEQGWSSGESGQGAPLFGVDGKAQPLAHTTSIGRCEGWTESERVQGRSSTLSSSAFVENTTSERRRRTRSAEPTGAEISRPLREPTRSSWWAVEPDVGRVAHGVPFRPHRLRCLGNSVVPHQAQEAFKILIGLP